jgi:DNA gyrase subunit A
MEVLPADEIMIITKHGVIIRSSVSQVRVTGRIAQGVKLVNLDEGDLVTAVARVVPEDDEEGAENESPAPDTEPVEALTDE